MKKCVLCNEFFNDYKDENICLNCEDYLEELRMIQEWEYYISNLNTEYEGNYEEF